MNVTSTCCQAFLFRLVISLVVFLVPGIPSLYRGLFLIYVSDFLDGIFFRINYPTEKEKLNNTYQYHLIDKVADALNNWLGLMLISSALGSVGLDVIYVALIWRCIGIIMFTQIKSSYVWLLFPDLTKELLLCRYVFGELTPKIFTVVAILKVGYEYYHHFINNQRDFDQSTNLIDGQMWSLYKTR